MEQQTSRVTQGTKRLPSLLHEKKNGLPFDRELSLHLNSIESELGLAGTFRDGFVSSGTPNPCPYSDHDLGYGTTHRGQGLIESAREFLATWALLGVRHKRTLAVYYWEPTGHRYLDAIRAFEADRRAMTSDELDTIGANQHLKGVLLMAFGDGAEINVRRAEDSVRAAHKAWAVVSSCVERKSAVRWKTWAL